ncbi:hypothetical protein ACVMIH_007733 [Bradyrhizobium sp. USDA 4503]
MEDVGDDWQDMQAAEIKGLSLIAHSTELSEGNRYRLGELILEGDTMQFEDGASARELGRALNCPDRIYTGIGLKP